jgi:hypothetical protein
LLHAATSLQRPSIVVDIQLRRIGLEVRARPAVMWGRLLTIVAAVTAEQSDNLMA